MSDHSPSLHLVCGKIASGKSTLAQTLLNQPLTVLLSEDILLSALYPGEIETIPDYVRRSNQLRVAISQHISDLLRAGLSVVLDFPANTVDTRCWMKSLGDDVGVPIHLHYLDVPNDVCLQRLIKRNAEGAHEFAATPEQFETITSYFEPPMEEEGFVMTVYPAS